MLFGKFIEAEGALAFQLRFLSKATMEDDDPRRSFMSDIYVEPCEKENELLGVTTDGRRLHLVNPLEKCAAEVFGMTPGWWRFFKNSSSKRVWVARIEDSQTNGWNFPNWRRIIPEGTPEYTTTFNGFSSSGERRGYAELAKFLRDFPEITAINLSYLQDIGIDYEWCVEWYGNNKPLKFIQSNRMVLIQPIQTD